MSFFCKECEFFANLTEITDHKQFHIALKVLGLKTIPKLEEELREHRKSLIDSALSKYLKKQDDFDTNKASEWSHKINQINNAYEVLKCHVDNSFEATRKTKGNKLNLDFHGNYFEPFYNFFFSTLWIGHILTVKNFLYFITLLFNNMINLYSV